MAFSIPYSLALYVFIIALNHCLRHKAPSHPIRSGWGLMTLGVTVFKSHVFDLTRGE